jgi:hypothetical protein
MLDGANCMKSNNKYDGMGENYLEAPLKNYSHTKKEDNHPILGHQVT